MKKKYSNRLYAFDIETTTTPNGVVAHYLSNFINVDFQFFKTDKSTILKHVSEPYFCRTAEDINNYLINLNNKALKDDEIYIIYVHHLAYEFDFLIKNITFVRDNFTNENSLFLKPRIPLFIRLQNIEFRCSYRLLNQSISCGTWYVAPPTLLALTSTCGITLASAFLKTSIAPVPVFSSTI